MEDFFLIIIAIFALYYIYKTIFKNRGCNCGSNNCQTKKDKN